MEYISSGVVQVNVIIEPVAAAAEAGEAAQP